jgi:TetR/AcrR family transcriptional repressor of uid operon
MNVRFINARYAESKWRIFHASVGARYKVARLADPELAERRRRQIMDAAIACFRRRGFHQSTMSEICAEAGISAGALYRYYPSKASIIGAIADDKHGETDAVFAEAAVNGSAVDALSLLARGFFTKFADGDGAVIAEIIAEAIRDDEIAVPLRAVADLSLRHCTEVIKAAQIRGEVDATLDPKTAANTLFAAIEGIGLRRAFQRDADTEAAVAQFRALAERYLEPRT